MGLLPNFQFKPTAIPKDNSLVVNQFGQTADALDKRYDEQLDFANKLSILASNVEVGEGDRQFKDTAIKRVDDLITRIQDENIGFENASLLLSKEARDFAKDPKLAQSRRNFLLMEETRKREDALRAQGKLSFESDIPNFQSVTKDAEGKDVFNTFQPTGEATLDHFGDAKKYFGTLKADLESLGISMLSMPGEPREPVRYVRQGTHQEITDPDILARANVVLKEFMQSSTGGNQFTRLKEQELRQQHPYASDEEIQQAVAQEAQDLLFAAGEDQTVSNTRESFSVNQSDLIGYRARLAAQETQQYGFNVSSTANRIPNNKLRSGNLFQIGTDGKLRVGQTELNLAKDLTVADAVGKSIGSTQPLAGPITRSAMKVYAHLKDFFNSDDITIDQLLSTEDGRKAFEVLEADNIIDRTTPPDVVQEELKKYLETFANQSVELEVNTLSKITHPNNIKNKITRKEYDDMVFAPDKDGLPTKTGVVTGMLVIPASPDAPNVGQTMNGNNFVELMRDKDRVVRTDGEATNNNPYFPGAVQVTDNEGAKYYIQNSKQENAINQMEWNFHQLNYSALPVINFNDGSREIKMNQDYKTKSIDITFKDANGNTVEPLTDANGNKPTNTYQAFQLYQYYKATIDRQ